MESMHFTHWQMDLNDGGKLFATSETVAGAWEVFNINRN